MKTREDILAQAFNECMEEMYKWAQPSVDIKALIADGYKDSKEHPLHDTHYLSQENFKTILEHYMYAFGIVDDWDDTFETICNQLENGGIEDDYKPAEGDRPGYRDYKKVDPLKEHLKTPEDFDTIIEYIKKVQNFFKGHSRERNSFSISVSLSYSPTCNSEEVEKYWKEHGRPDFKIKNYDINDIIYGSDEDEDITEEEFINTLK